MRIDVLAWRDLDDPDAGGSEQWVHENACRWAAAGHDVHAWAAGPNVTYRRGGYAVHRHGSRTTVFPAVIRHLSRILRDVNTPAGVVVTVQNGVPWLPSWWCPRPAVNVIHHDHHNMWPAVLGPAAPAGQILEHRIGRAGARRAPLVTVSPSSARQLENAGWTVDHTIEPGVRDIFTPGGTKTPHPRLVTVGRLAPVKRHLALIDQIDQCRADHPDLELVIVGGGPEHDRIAAAAATRSSITVTGRIDDRQLVELYRNAWLAVSASAAEGWGLTLTEAAACGTPAVATDIAGHRDSIHHETTGMLAPLDQLGATINTLLRDKDTRQRMGVAAAAYAAELTWDRASGRLLDILETRHAAAA